MAHNSAESEGIRVLVCGSSRWEDRQFVHSMLAGFASQFDISAILSGPFSGADEIAKNWAKERGIPYEPVNIGDSERMQLSFFDETRDLPELLVRNDSMFRKGYEKLRDSAPTAVLFIPNPDGQLGPTCACLRRMADMVDIPCINGAEALQAVARKMSTVDATSAPVLAAPAEEPEVALAAGRLGKSRF